ncbi:hypothetical protein LguiA_021817 [Lonicera macranthoides]
MLSATGLSPFRVQHSIALPSSTTLVLSPTTPFSRFRLLPFRSPILWYSLLLSFPLATKMFQFAKLSLACPWIQQQLKRLTYSGISGSILIFNSPKYFVAYYALPLLWVPRYCSRVPFWGLAALIFGRPYFSIGSSIEFQPSRSLNLPSAKTQNCRLPKNLDPYANRNSIWQGTKKLRFPQVIPKL